MVKAIGTCMFYAANVYEREDKIDRECLGRRCIDCEYYRRWDKPK